MPTVIIATSGAGKTFYAEKGLWADGDDLVGSLGGDERLSKFVSSLGDIKQRRVAFNVSPSRLITETRRQGVSAPVKVMEVSEQQIRDNIAARVASKDKEAHKSMGLWDADKVLSWQKSYVQEAKQLGLPVVPPS